MGLDGQFLQDTIDGLNNVAGRTAAGLLGLPVDTSEGLLNLAIAAGGTAGRATGLLGVDDMPQLRPPQPGSSDWFGNKMVQAGMMTGERNPLGELLASFVQPGTPATHAAAVMPMMSEHLAGAMPLLAGSMSRVGGSRLLEALESKTLPGPFSAGTITGGQAKAINQVAGGPAVGSEVMMTDEAVQHMIDSRMTRDNFSPKEVVNFVRQAMEPRSRVWVDPAAQGHKPALINDGLTDAVTGRRYAAQLPMRNNGGVLEAVTVVPKGLPPR